MKSQQLPIPRVIGHRGACGYAPENTLAAMRKAKALGVQWVEFDVMLTRCGEAIVMHDASVDRTTNGHGLVAQTSYQDIQQLDAGAWFSMEYTGEKVPTLVEMLCCLKELGLGMNLEIKAAIGKERDTTLKIIETVKKYWSSSLPVPLLSSFSLLSLEVAREVDREIRLGWIISSWPKETATLFKLLTQLDCVSLHVNHHTLTAERVAMVKQTYRHVLAYTVNDFERALTLFRWGIDAVFSDYPDRVLLSRAVDSGK